MFNLSFIALFLQLIAFCYATLPLFPERLMELPQYKGKYTGKIVGGDQVPDCWHSPHQCSVQRKSIMTAGFAHFCGASIINKRYVVTAAHCVNGRSSSSLSIVVGTHKLDQSGREGIRKNIENVTVHKDYSSKNVDYDIAILKLSSDLELKDCVGAATLPKQNEDFATGTPVFATGWGTTAEGGSTSSTLRVVEVPVVSQEECGKSYGVDEITPRMICAGLAEGGKDSCQGDSGGPLVTSGRKLVGITSWGYGCARPDYFGVYTRVSHFIDWIQLTIKSMERSE